jgi:hypothetical protein
MQLFEGFRSVVSRHTLCLNVVKEVPRKMDLGVVPLSWSIFLIFVRMSM